MPPRDFLIITDAVAPLVEGEAPLAAAGVSRALAAAGHRTTVLSLGAPESVARVPGLARRLRTISASIGDQTLDLSLYEGRAVLSNSQLMIIAAQPSGRAQTAALLGSAVKSLASDGLIAPEVTIGWGETAAAALSATSAAVRLFVLPSGRVGAPLSPADAQLLGTTLLADDLASRSLVALGSLSANAILAPSASAARALGVNAGLAARASDEPLVAVRFGSDEPPNDPGTDPALVANYSPANLAGKIECRRAIARRCSLALGPRTLLLAIAPLRRDKGGDVVLAALERLSPHDVVAIIPADGDPEMIERASLLAIENPGRLAVLAGDDDATERQVRAAADALLLADDDDRTGRAAALAQRYGTLPIAVDAGANRDNLIDYDPRSATGSALLYGSLDPFQIESAIRRAIALRSDGDLWSPLVKALLEIAPRWSATAAAIDEICGQI
ncbi:MAG: starch synthase [Myxococcales bacterium]|nr:starch synthase [Myxococcales bacterium]